MDVLLFPPTSTNLIVGSSNCGKTHLVQHIVLNFNLFFPYVRGNRNFQTYDEDDNVGEEGGELEEGELVDSDEGDEDPPSVGHEYQVEGRRGGRGYTRIIVVHCNPKTPRWPVDFPLGGSKLRLTQLDIEEFDLNLVSPNSLVVFDDVSALHDSITSTINVGSHHIPLLSVFVVSQNIVGNLHYALTKLCHRVIFCCNTLNALDAANNILRKQVADVELRQHLQDILAFCHKQKTKFLLELNNLATYPTQYHGFSHLNELAPPFPYCLAYALEGSPASVWWKEKGEKKILVSPEALSRMEQHSLEQKSAFAEMVKSAKNLPKNTMIVVPVGNLDLKESEVESNVCTPQSMYKKVKEIIEEDIELAFDTKKWKVVKPLAAILVKVKQFCISANGKFFWVNPEFQPREEYFGMGTSKSSRRRKRKREMSQSSKVNIINFLYDVTRGAAPHERMKPEWRHYKYLVHLLRQYGASQQNLKNKMIC
jgi:hypothetical protein